MVGFYYEDYKFLPDKRYIILYRGCFQVLHKGHYSLLEKYIHLPNVKYYISQMDRKKRHGVPYYFSRKIWKMYIDELVPEHKNKIILKEMKTSLDVLDFVDDIDVVIFLRGGEEGEDLKQLEKDRAIKYEILISKLKRRGIKMDFLVIDRPPQHSFYDETRRSSQAQ